MPDPLMDDPIVGPIVRRMDGLKVAIESEQAARLADLAEQRKASNAAARASDDANSNASRARRVAVLAVVIAVVGVGSAWFARTAADSAQQKLDAALANITAARATSCNEANRDRIAFNSAVLDLAGFDTRTGQEKPRDEPRTPEQQARLDEFLANRLRPLRVCETEAIEAYLASNGVQGVRSIDPTNYLTALQAP